ncbi:N-acetyltransferase eso1 [Paramyrothecium foliicola]|nr:N-acetyltransferase eso1 [Paramyrothecium foliicola]
MMESSRHTFRHLDMLSNPSTTSPLRVIALIDFDAFYAQCETVRLGLPPTLPLAVQQWNAIIALNYPARERGLKRGLSVEEVKKICPEIILQHVATWREGETSWAYRPDFAEHMSTDKSALDPYRLRSRKCFEFIRGLLPNEPAQRVEKASIDEVFLDLSAQVHGVLLEQFPELSDRSNDPDCYIPLPSFSSPLDWESDHVVDIENANPQPDWDDIALNIGAGIVRRIRAEILAHFKYTYSAGIARNKMLAKLGAGFRKPNQQTVIPAQAARGFLATHRITKIRGLGGKLGSQVITAFGADRVADIIRVPREELKAKLGDEPGNWVYDILRGRDTSIVTPRIAVQSMLSAKTFVPHLSTFGQATKWLRIFAADLVSRLNELQEEYPRQPTIVALHHHINGRFGPTRSKQTTIPMGSIIDETALFSWSETLLRQLCDDAPSWPCASLSISISGFHNLVTRNHRITSFFVKENPNRNQNSHDHSCNMDEQHKPKRPMSAIDQDTDVKDTNTSNKSQVSQGNRCLPIPLEDIEVGSAPAYDCPNCNQGIRESRVLEHLDWHTAHSIQELGDQ